MRELRSILGQESIAALAQCDAPTAHRVLSAFCWSAALVSSAAPDGIVAGAVRVLVDELRKARAAMPDRDRKELHS